MMRKWLLVFLSVGLFCTTASAMFATAGLRVSIQEERDSCVQLANRHGYSGKTRHDYISSCQLRLSCTRKASERHMLGDERSQYLSRCYAGVKDISCVALANKRGFVGEERNEYLKACQKYRVIRMSCAAEADSRRVTGHNRVIYVKRCFVKRAPKRTSLAATTSETLVTDTINPAIQAPVKTQEGDPANQVVKTPQSDPANQATVKTPEGDPSKQALVKTPEADPSKLKDVKTPDTDSSCAQEADKNAITGKDKDEFVAQCKLGQADDAKIRIGQVPETPQVDPTQKLDPTQTTATTDIATNVQPESVAATSPTPNPIPDPTPDKVATVIAPVKLTAQDIIKLDCEKLANHAGILGKQRLAYLDTCIASTAQHGHCSKEADINGLTGKERTDFLFKCHTTVKTIAKNKSKNVNSEAALIKNTSCETLAERRKLAGQQRDLFLTSCKNYTDLKERCGKKANAVGLTGDAATAQINRCYQYDVQLVSCKNQAELRALQGKERENFVIACLDSNKTAGKDPKKKTDASTSWVSQATALLAKKPEVTVADNTAMADVQQEKTIIIVPDNDTTAGTSVATNLDNQEDVRVDKKGAKIEAKISNNAEQINNQSKITLSALSLDKDAKMDEMARQDIENLNQ